MNARNAVSGIGSATVPGAVIVGAFLLVSSVAGLQAQRDHYRSEASRPKPTTTATVTAPAPEPARTTVVARPSATPTSATVVPVSDAIAAMPHNGSGGLSHGQARPPSTPQPSPAAAPCSGQALTVRVRHAACVSIGGGS